MTQYEPLQIRDVILKCEKGFTEHFLKGDIPHIIYFSNLEGKDLELRMHERYEEEEIEELCKLIGIPIEQFKILYKKAKKHKL